MQLGILVPNISHFVQVPMRYAFLWGLQNDCSRSLICLHIKYQLLDNQYFQTETSNVLTRLARFCINITNAKVQQLSYNGWFKIRSSPSWLMIADNHCSYCLLFNAAFIIITKYMSHCVVISFQPVSVPLCLLLHALVWWGNSVSNTKHRQLMHCTWTPITIYAMKYNHYDITRWWLPVR